MVRFIRNETNKKTLLAKCGTPKLKSEMFENTTDATNDESIRHDPQVMQIRFKTCEKILSNNTKENFLVFGGLDEHFL